MPLDGMPEFPSSPESPPLVGRDAGASGIRHRSCEAVLASQTFSIAMKTTDFSTCLPLQSPRIVRGFTVLELLMIWQLLQVNHLQRTPLVLVGGMWPGLVEWAKEAMLSTDPPLASAKDFAIPRCAADADEAIALMREHHRRWKREQSSARDARASSRRSAR